MVQTRKSTRIRSLSTKAKQLQETIKKPVLRSINTIDDNENTYNNLSFKKRKLSPIENSQQDQSDQSDADDQSDEDEDEDELIPNFNTTEQDDLSNDEDLSDDNAHDGLFFNSEEENIFNSDDDDYYSAISDYDEIETKPTTKRFITHSKITPKFSDDHHHHHHPHNVDTHFITTDHDLLFDSDDSDSSSSQVSTPINQLNPGDLKNLEENFKKIIDENKKLESSSKFNTNQISKPLIMTKTITIDDFVDYSSDPQDSITTSTPSDQLFKPSKFLQYRHDEKHNLAFPDVSTFPIGFDPFINNNRDSNNRSKVLNTKKIRALNRRAILTGKASEMVGTGLNIGDLNFL